MTPAGVYEIRNTLNGKVYIGSSVNVGRRLAAHRWELRAGKHFSTHLQAAWNKHGEHQFVFKPLLYCSEDQRFFYEQIVMDGFKSNQPEHGYNKLLIVTSHAGMKFSEERRRLQSQVVPRGAAHHNFGKDWGGPEARKAARASVVGVPFTRDAKAKQSMLKTGKKMPEGFSEKMRQSRLGAAIPPATLERMRVAHSSMNVTKANQIRQGSALGSLPNELALAFGVSRKVVRSILAGKTWK